eukprot:scaffold3118_cov64-Cylindrotheca_fusiformis.AAC.21
MVFDNNKELLCSPLLLRNMTKEKPPRSPHSIQCTACRIVGSSRHLAVTRSSHSLLHKMDHFVIHEDFVQSSHIAWITPSAICTSC